MSLVLASDKTKLNDNNKKPFGIRSATIEPVPKDSSLMLAPSIKYKIVNDESAKKKKSIKKKSKSTDIRKFFGISTLDDKQNIIIPVKPGKVIYERKTYDMGDGAKCIYIPGYVRNPDALFTELKEKIDWGIWKFELHGKEVQSPRLISVIHFDEEDTSDLPELGKIKERIEKFTKLEFRYGVCNYYRDGRDCIAKHSDKENMKGNTVVSVTVGSTRKFVMKHKFRKDVKYVFPLNHGDVLILNDEAIRKIYTHEIPRVSNAGPRINITFRE